MKTILVTAYAINPYKGSEDGTGWNYVSQIARFNKVVAITRKNNIPEIERYIKENGVTINARFIGYDLPKWASFWKRGGNGAMLYFYLWQFFMVSFVKAQKLQFDIAHNLNFHTDWVPTFLWRLNKPVVWGPVGHHPKVPSGYYTKTNSTFIDRSKNHLIWFVKLFFWNLDPFMFVAKQKVAKVICINKAVEEVLRLPESKIVRFFSVGANARKEELKQNTEKFRVLSVGRLVPLKGFDITLKSFHAFYKQLGVQEQQEVELVIVGKGSMLPYLKNYVSDNELNKVVKFVDWVSQDELANYYNSSNVFMFPSHEGAGMVVPEALSFGLPVICFNNCGPGSFIDSLCGFKIEYSNYKKSIAEFSEALHFLYSDKNLRYEVSKGALQRFKDAFWWDSKGDILRDVYNDL